MGIIDLDTHLGPDPVIAACKRHVGRALLRENIRLTVELRINGCSGR